MKRKLILLNLEATCQNLLLLLLLLVNCLFIITTNTQINITLFLNQEISLPKGVILRFFYIQDFLELNLIDTLFPSEVSLHFLNFYLTR